MKIHKILILIALLTTGKISAQNIAEIGKSDPLIITGSLGSRNTFYHSSSGNGHGSPLSSSLYTNMNISLYGISMPFSFYYNNDNYNFSYPQISFNISPSYKGWTLHLGKHSMPFSSYIYNVPFNGVGLEYKQSKGAGIRFGAFYGELRKAVNANPEDININSPAYRRSGWGLKVGFGNNKNYCDLYLFKAKDHLSSIDDKWQDIISAQDNIAVGLRGKFSLGRHFHFSGNVATSIFSSDLNSSIIDVEKAKKYNKLFDVRYSTLLRWAGDVSMTTVWKNFSTAIFYKLVQPDYNSLGISYMNSNYHSLGIASNGRIGKLSLGGNFSAQSDNLSNKQLQTTKGYVYSANATLPIGKHFNISANYNGYLQRQFAGTKPVNDTTRIYRIMNSCSFSGGYDVTTETAGHSISLTGNYSNNKDLNPFATGESDVNTWATGLGYSISVISIETNFGANFSHQCSNGYHTKYTTDMYSVSASKALLKSKKLRCNATFSLINNKMGKEKNFSLGGNLSMGYSLFDLHNFSFSLNYNQFASTNFVADKYKRDKSYDLTCSLNYVFSFTALSIKRREKKEREAEKARKYEIYSDFSRAAYRERRLKLLQEEENRKNKESIKKVEF